MRAVRAAARALGLADSVRRPRVVPVLLTMSSMIIPNPSPFSTVFDVLTDGRNAYQAGRDDLAHIKDRFPQKVLSAVMSPVTDPQQVALRRSAVARRVVDDQHWQTVMFQLRNAGCIDDATDQVIMMAAVDLIYRINDETMLACQRSFADTLDDVMIVDKVASAQKSLSTLNSTLDSVEQLWNQLQGTESSGRAQFTLNRHHAVQAPTTCSDRMRMPRPS